MQLFDRVESVARQVEVGIVACEDVESLVVTLDALYILPREDVVVLFVVYAIYAERVYDEAFFYNRIKSFGS